MERRGTRPEILPGRRTAQSRHSVLLLPHHGRHRLHHDRAGLHRRGAVAHGPALHDALVPARHGARLAARLHRRACRLVRGRGRPPAMGGLWPAAHRRRRLARSRRQRGCLDCPIRHRLRHRVRRRRLLHGPARAPRAWPDPAGSRGRRPVAPALSSSRCPMTPASMDMAQLLPVFLPLVWAAILALAVFLYVLLGGYDLVLGVLVQLAPSHRDRDALMASVAAFLLAYSVMLPALYIPLILMLLGLILRGVAFKFRFKSSRFRWAWDLAFAGGSTVAALMQGGAIGAFVQGFAVTDNKFSGGAFDWLTPFSIVTSVAVLSGYVLLSAGWLIMKADEALRDWAYGVARIALIAVALFIVAFSVWTPLLHPDIAARWFSPGNMVMFCPVPLLTAAAVIGLWRGIAKRQRYAPFLWGAAIFQLCYIGLAISLFPFIIPPDITIWQAAAAPDSQLFMLYGAVPLLPIILGYTAYSYYVLWEAPETDAY